MISLILVGLCMGSLSYSPFKLDVYAMHKSFGLLILFLVGLRILWKSFTTKPETHKNHKIWEKILAKIAHVFLYVAMIGMPLSGWIMSSAAEYPVPFFGFEMPDIVGKDKVLASLGRQTHEILGYMLIIAITLHAIGAIKHHFIDKDTTLIRIAGVRNIRSKVVLIFVLLGIFFGGIAYTQFFIADEKSVTTQSATSQENSNVEKTQWVIDQKQSKLEFEASVYKTPFTGEFKNFDGVINFDLDNLDTAKVDIKIEILSVESGDEQRDASMVKEEWFNVNQYPIAQFVADNFEKTGVDQYLAKGNLTIRGVTKALNLPFALNFDGDQAMMEATVTLNRLDFGLGDGEWKEESSVGHNVKLYINLKANKSNN